MEAITLKSFHLVVTNINGFRAFNHVHGFDQGDRMILLLAEIMARQVKTFVRDAVESLLKKAKRFCLSDEKSSVALDNRVRSIRTSKEAKEDAVLELNAEYSTSS